MSLLIQMRVLTTHPGDEGPLKIIQSYRLLACVYVVSVVGLYFTIVMASASLEWLF